MANFNTNISVDEIIAQKEAVVAAATPQKKEIKFDEKNYLNARLKEGETSKTLVIRLLPYDTETSSPFKKVWMHTLKVSKEVSPSGWRSFPCPTKNELGDSCPICNIAKAAKEKMFSVSDEGLKKKCSEMEYAHRAKETWVVRCIERGKEEEGVKFWQFPHNRKKQGVWDKIMNKFENRYNAAKAVGKESNIFDLNNGKDLIVTISRGSDGKTAVDIDVADESTPLTNDYELGMKWINDPKKWDDVFTVKKTEYMRIIAEGGVPVWDKEKGGYVDKYAEKEEENTEMTDTNVNVTVPSNDVAAEVIEDLPW